MEKQEADICRGCCDNYRGRGRNWAKNKKQTKRKIMKGKGRNKKTKGRNRKGEG